MHVKARPAAALAALLLLVGSSGCALIAGLGGEKREMGEVNDRGSKPPGRDADANQREGGVELPGCSTDVSVDPNNCGACGHSCAGAACKGGVCRPTTIAPATDVKLLAVDVERVVYATEREVRGCPATPNASCSTLIDPGLVSGAVRGSGGNGGNGGDSGKLDIRALTLFGDRFFVSEETSSAVVGCPKSGCTSRTIAVIRTTPSPGFSSGLNVSANRVNWGERDGLGEAALPGDGNRLDGIVIPMPVAKGAVRMHQGVLVGGQPELVFRGSNGVFTFGYDQNAQVEAIYAESSVRDFAIDPRFVYVATKSSVVRVDRVDRTRLVMIEDDDLDLDRIVADADGVYVKSKDASGAQISRVREGGVVEPIAKAADIGLIALAGLHVYFTSGGAIQRTPR